MADDNKISFDVELDQGSINTNFGLIDKRAEKSAKTSAAVFGEHFQKQEQDLKESIERLNKASSKAAAKSAEESAAVFRKAFEKQNDIYKASVKQNLDQAINEMTGGNRVKKSAQESASAFEEAFAKLEPAKNAKLSLTDLAAGYYLVKEAIDKVGQAARAGLDFVLRGEAELKLEARFKALASQANVAADVIENKLAKAARGLLEDDEYLQLGASAFVRIGETAEQLPQIIEAARKSYKVFGGEVTSNAEAIITATETGNKRALRSVGLYTDLEAAVKKYAREAGTIPALLSEQQLQTARLNAILETADKRFKNITLEADSVKDAFTRAKVSFSEFVDEIAKASAQESGGFFKSLLNGTASFLDALRDGSALQSQANSVSEINKQLEILNRRNEEYRKEIALLDKDALLYTASFNGSTLAIQKNEIAIDGLRRKLSDLREAQRVSGVNAGSGVGDTKQDAEVQAEYLKRREELKLKVQQLNQAQTASDVQVAQERFNILQNSANFEALHQTKLKQIEEQGRTERAALEKFFTDNGVNDVSLRQQAREMQEQDHLNKMLAMNIAYEEQKKSIFNESSTLAIDAGSAFNSILEGMDMAAQELAVNATKNFKNLGKTMFNTLGSAAGQAFAAFGAAIHSGENALAAFGKALLNSLGQLAVQMGTQFILQGAAYTWAGLANGPSLMAAGAALAAFGGILSASGGAGPQDAGGGGGASSSGGIDSGPVTEYMPPDSMQPTGPQTAVSVTVQGNVLDNRETGLYIAEVLREQFDQQGLVVTTG